MVSHVVSEKSLSSKALGTMGTLESLAYKGAYRGNLG